VNILLSGDLHFNKDQFRWLKDQKNKYDCLCLTGDFLDGDSGDYKQQSEWVSDWLNDFGIQIFICSGNHDLDELSECEWLENVENKRICRDNQTKLFKGIKFGCMPYLGADLSRFCDCDVLLTHVPPAKTATSQSVVAGRTTDWGDEELYHVLKEGIISPRYILCGHVENPLVNRDWVCETEIINPGAEHESSVPNHEIISFETSSCAQKRAFNGGLLTEKPRV